jgi:hypothetical protein
MLPVLDTSVVVVDMVLGVVGPLFFPAVPPPFAGVLTLDGLFFFLAVSVFNSSGGFLRGERFNAGGAFGDADFLRPFVAAFFFGPALVCEDTADVPLAYRRHATSFAFTEAAFDFLLTVA